MWERTIRALSHLQYFFLCAAQKMRGEIPSLPAPLWKQRDGFSVPHFLWNMGEGRMHRMEAGEGLRMLGSLFGVFWLSLAFTGVVQAALALVDGQMFHVEH